MIEITYFELCVVVVFFIAFSALMFIFGQKFEINKFFEEISKLKKASVRRENELNDFMRSVSVLEKNIDPNELH